jgi:uncharacterized protein
MAYALITGASKGIGRAIAFQLAKRNYDLILTARSTDLLCEVSEEIKKLYAVKIYFFSLDLSESGASRKLFDWCIENKYHVAILINNAGYGLSGAFQKTSIEKNTNLLQLNMIAPTQLCQLFIPMLLQATKGYIMNIASTASYQAIPYLTIYAASKAYMQRFSRGLSEELSKTSISVTCISPGPTDTDWASSADIHGKALKLADKLNMDPDTLASLAVKAMFEKRTEFIPGFINKMGVFMAWLLPKKLVERSTGNLYK